MIDYVYEVRFPENPDPSFTQRFRTKSEAINFANEYGNAEVYMLTVDCDSEDDVCNLVQEMQIMGPEADRVSNDPTVPNSCDGDNCDNYDDEGNFRLPVMKDELDEELNIDELVKDEQEAIDAYTKAKDATDNVQARDVFDHIKAEEEEHIDELKELEDMTDAELGEALFSAIHEARSANPDVEESDDKFDYTKLGITNM